MRALTMHARVGVDRRGCQQLAMSFRLPHAAAKELRSTHERHSTSRDKNRHHEVRYFNFRCSLG
jgi:hypothetical protein